MAYSKNILPRDAAYYRLSNASISSAGLHILAGGYAEIDVTEKMLPSVTNTMLVVAHASVLSSRYTNNAVQVTLRITTENSNVDCLVPICDTESGVFNTEVKLPEGAYSKFTYRISSSVEATVYNWELCALDAGDITTIIDGVEQTIPKLLYDYNTYAYAVGQREETVGLITCYLKSGTDLQGHFTLSFFATERCNVHIRCKDNGITELFSPLVYTVEKGYASVSIPHAYLHKLATDHAFSVTAQCTNGQLSIPVRGMLYTIDGGYLATRLLDAGSDVLDISIRQVEEDYRPSEIWSVGLESRQAVVKRCAYEYTSGASWEAIKTFGEAIDAAIEFRGHWQFRDSSAKITLITEDAPYVFIVDTAGTLSAYKDYDASFVLDTGVSAVAACQGFQSMHIESNDQGLVVAYIKSGKVYYRQYAYFNDTYHWLPSIELYSVGDAKGVNVHRLPDYRIGICVRHSTGTKWYISTRTYVSQGVKPEVLHCSTESMNIITIFDKSREADINGTATKNTLVAGEVFDTFTMTFIGKIVMLNSRSTEDFTRAITVSVNGTKLTLDAIKEVTVTNNVVTVKLTSGQPAGSTVTIDFNFPYIAMLIYNGCRAAVTSSYTWNLPFPTTTVPVPETAEASVDVSFVSVMKPRGSYTRNYSDTATTVIDADFTSVVKKVTTNSKPSSESANAQCEVSFSSTVTQVGVTPL